MIVLERFEEDHAVLETDSGTVTVPRTALPAQAAVGDILIPASNGGYTVDRSATTARKKSISERFRRLRNR